MSSSGFYGQDVLTGASSRLTAAYEHRSPDESLDDMVQRNIRDVLQAVERDDTTQTQQQQHLEQQQQRALRASGSDASLDERHGGYGNGGDDDDAYAFDDVVAAATTSGGADAAKGGSGGGGHGRGGAGKRGSAGAAASSTAFLDVPGQPDASLRLHKARIRTLEDELSKANRALAERDRQLADALKELKALKAEQGSWSKEKKVLEAQVDKLKRQAADAEAVARGSDQQARELAKADSRAERERRAAEADVRTRDIRLQRALEEVDRYKALLQEVRVQERDAKGAVQGDVTRLTAENRKLERQRAELIVAFKKQLKLIEVLKRQKVHLEAARALQFTEEEFLKTLDMGAA